MSTLLRFGQWYARQCDGEWEHGHVVSIQSCDNPGWWVKIDLKGTALELVPFEPLSVNIGPARFPQSSDWLDCRVTDGVWNGAGDETKLEELLATFLTWAESYSSE